jgi:DHA1 family multidrug resistance protein-like MFS transporter
MVTAGAPSLRRAAWSALLLAALTDALLVPFYPQFFAQTFGSSSLVTPGLYVALCRLAIAVTLPFWTRLTRRVAPLRLVAAAQVIAGSAGLLCAVAPNLHAFLAFTFIAEGARGCYLLLYPVLVQSVEPARRSSVVATVAAAINGAGLLAALLGGVLLENLGGRTALVIAGLSDYAQLLCLLPVLARHGAPVPAPAPDTTAQMSGKRPAVRVRLYLLCVVTFFATGAIVLIRPHFTTFVDAEIAPGLPLWVLGAVFVIPNAVAVLATRLGGRVAHSPHARLWLVGAAWALAITAVLQLASPSLAFLIAARAAHGLAIYLIDVTVDYATLCGDQDTYGQFGIMSAFQNASIVVAPLAAGVLADLHGWSTLFHVTFLAGAVAALGAMALGWSASRAAAAGRAPASSPPVTSAPEKA